MEKFGEGISDALKSKAFRTLIKTEALKRFNKDTDVLYQTIKNLPINGAMNFRTTATSASAGSLHYFLIPFFASEQELNDFENSMPLLTIFVPDLPQDYFSAESWNVNDENQIPDVALRLDNITYVPVIGRDDDNYLIAPEDVPSWPIVVLKDNERVVADTDPSFASLDTRIISTGSTGTLIKFIDNNFDPLFQPLSAYNGFQGANDNFIPVNLQNAYDTFQNDPTGGWHRDFVYYGLTPTNTAGPINVGRFREHIATFKLTGTTPQGAFNSISDSFNETRSDARLRDTWQRRVNGVAAWTDGSFEIIISCSFGARSSNLGPITTNVLPASADDLFQVMWDQQVTGFSWWRRFWLKPRIVASKTMNTAMPTGPRLEFSTWDLYNFSNHWSFSFEERDASTTTTTSETVTSKFNANFVIDAAAGGILKKIGLKFGASFETTNSNTFTVVTVAGNDKLGLKEINFYDNPINKINGTYSLRKFANGNVEFSLLPLQVQF